jgi:hypothetical protein
VASSSSRRSETSDMSASRGDASSRVSGAGKTCFIRAGSRFDAVVLTWSLAERGGSARLVEVEAEVRAACEEWPSVWGSLGAAGVDGPTSTIEASVGLTPRIEVEEGGVVEAVMLVAAGDLGVFASLCLRVNKEPEVEP